MHNGCLGRSFHEFSIWPAAYHCALVPRARLPRRPWPRLTTRSGEQSANRCRTDGCIACTAVGRHGSTMRGVSCVGLRECTRPRVGLENEFCSFREQARSLARLGLAVDSSWFASSRELEPSCCPFTTSLSAHGASTTPPHLLLHPNQHGEDYRRSSPPPPPPPTELLLYSRLTPITSAC